MQLSKITFFFVVLLERWVFMPKKSAVFDEIPLVSPDKSPADLAKDFVQDDNDVVDPLLPLAIEYLRWLRDVKYPTDHNGKRLSVLAVSEITGYSIHTINNFLYGKTLNPRFFKLSRLIAAFGGSVDELLGIGKHTTPWIKPESYAPSFPAPAPAPIVEPPVVAPAPDPVPVAPVSVPVPEPSALFDSGDLRSIYDFPLWQRPFVRASRNARKVDSAILASRDAGTVAALLFEVKSLRKVNVVLLFALIASIAAVVALFAYDLIHIDNELFHSSIGCFSSFLF